MIFKKKEKKEKRAKNIFEQLPTAIVYLSDAFIFLIVFTWSFYIINAVIGGWYELITIKSTNIFTDLKEACTIPLTAGGIAWLLRTAANHITAGLNGHRLSFDFPNEDEDGNEIDTYEDANYMEEDHSNLDESCNDDIDEETIIDGNVDE